jgi:hypothetical protein
VIDMQSPTLPIETLTARLPQDGQIANVAEREVVSANTAEQAALQRAQLLDDADWHPSEAEKAAALHAVKQPVVSRQATLPLGAKQ